MIQKEFRELWRGALAPYLILLAVPLLRFLRIGDAATPLWRSGGELLPLLFAAILYANAFGSGLYLFRSEHKDQAWEYLLTLPHGRWRLLGWKTAPRLLLLAPQMVVYLALGGSRQHHFLLHPGWMGLWLLLLLVLGMSLSLFEQKNTMAVLSLCVFYAIVFLFLAVRRLLPELPAEQAAWCAALPIVILALAFIREYRRFDLAAQGRRSGIFVWTTLSPIVLLTLAGMAVVFL